MAIDTELKYAALNDLYLDPMNPRLGRTNTGPEVKQEKILDLMRGWTLDELAVSIAVTLIAGKEPSDSLRDLP